MTPYLITVCLLVEAHEHPEGQVAEALQVLGENDLPKDATTRSALIRWVIGADDIASSIAHVPLLDDEAPNGTLFSLWPGKMF
jgi:hypothetical protein